MWVKEVKTLFYSSVISWEKEKENYQNLYRSNLILNKTAAKDKSEKSLPEKITTSDKSVHLLKHKFGNITSPVFLLSNPTNDYEITVGAVVIHNNLYRGRTSTYVNICPSRITVRILILNGRKSKQSSAATHDKNMTFPFKSIYLQIANTY